MSCESIISSEENILYGIFRSLMKVSRSQACWDSEERDRERHRERDRESEQRVGNWKEKCIENLLEIE